MVYMSANSERVKRWRDKHRALHNLRRRNARKKGLSSLEEEPQLEAAVVRTEMQQKEVHANDVVKEVNRPSISELRELVEEEREKPPATSVEAPPTVYRNDYGGVISKFQWEKLQRIKAHAKENNFEIDEYSQ